MIKTTEKMRKLYAKHIKVNYKDDFTFLKDLYKGEPRTCYMCEAATVREEIDVFYVDCDLCPLAPKFIGGCCVIRGPRTREERMNWIITQINKHTDCKMVG
jgi:hypothetical protein